MEHEYYSGISLAIMVYFAVTKLGPKLAEFADKEIDVSLKKKKQIYWTNLIKFFRESNLNGTQAVQIQLKI